MPVGRLGSPKKVASVVKFVGDRVIVAQAVSADGGMYHR
jgi:hypothetical protein